MVYKFFDKETESRLSVNEELAQELHKPVIKTFKKGKSMQSLKIVFEHADTSDLTAKNILLL